MIIGNSKVKIAVKNAIDTKDEISPCGSWLNYWEEQTSLKARECFAIDCDKKDDLVGAHVLVIGYESEGMFIVPLCKECNKRTETFYVNGPLVSAPK